ncbi:MAG: cyclic nucleotide-binding domain-containing protein [Planctomycetaceae bacterium]
MEYVVLGIVIAIAVLVITNDLLEQRRYLRTRTDVPRLVAERLEASRTVTTGARTSLLPRVAPVRVPGAEGAAEPTGIWADLSERVDPEKFRPKLAEGCEVKFFRLRWGDDYAMLADPGHTAHYKLEVWEGRLVESLDGTRTVSEVVVDHLTGSGDFDAGAIVSLIVSLREVGIFEGWTVNVTALLEERVDTATSGRRRLREFMKTLRIQWTGADALVRRLYDGGVRLCYQPSAVVIGLVVSLGGLIAFLSAVLSGRHHIVIGNATVQTFVMMGLGLILTAAHELGHASTLVHFRRKVLGAGFLLYYGTPAFFIDTSDGQMLERGPRMLQAIAGPFAESVLAGCSSLLLFVFPTGPFSDFLYKFSVLNYYVIFLNLIPLLELDGYWVLADGIEVPDLRPRSIAFIRKDMWHKLFRRERFSLQEVALGAYGILGIVFTILTSLTGLLLWKHVFGGLVIELWDSGPASRVLMVVLVAFFAGPILRGLVALVRTIVRRVRAVWQRIRFRFETSWRVEAAEMIDALPGFEELPVDVLNDLAGRIRLRQLSRDEAVFRQGDVPDAFYVVRSGTVAVEDQDPDTGDTRTIRTLSRGDAFGEVGLLNAAPRQATVRAVGAPAELYRVDKNAFDRLLADVMRAPRFAPTMQAYAELRELAPFRRLTSTDLGTLLEHGEWVVAPAGDVLVRQGDVGDAFYVVASGRAEVVQDGASLADLGPGEFFGEIALLEDVPRTASVVAKTPLRVFRLDRDGFDGLVAGAFKTGTLRTAANREWEH